MISQTVNRCLLVSSVLWFLGAVANAGTAEDGMAMFKAGKYIEARDTFEKALKTEHNNPNLLYYYALTLSRLGSNAQARTIYQEIISHFSDSQVAAYASQALGLPAMKPKTQTAPSNNAGAIINLGAGETIPVYPGAFDVKQIDPKFAPWEFQVVATMDDMLTYYSRAFSESGWKVRVDTATAQDNAGTEEDLGNKGAQIVKRCFLVCSKGLLRTQVTVIQYNNTNKLEVFIPMTHQARAGEP
jgi:tetratricopeptide (TPR) repeat protein